ncbi:MAG: hypothetical protein AAF580_08875 [Pseudomonadota bacterium]
MSYPASDNAAQPAGAMAATQPIVDQVVISSTDAARYIEGMCAELKSIADQANLAFLSYLLEMALEEATSQANSHSAYAIYGEVPPRPTGA